MTVSNINHVEKIFITIFDPLLKCTLFGLKKVWKEKVDYYLFFISLYLVIFATIYGHRFEWKKYSSVQFCLPEQLINLIYNIHWSLLFIGTVTSISAFLFFFIGVKDFLLILNFQQKLNRIGLKGSEGSYFNVVAVNKTDEFKTTLVIKSVGIGIDKYQQKKADIEASLAEEIDLITNGGNPQIIIMYLTKRKLPKLVKFHDIESHLLTPHSFIIGESMKGVVTKTLESLPHLLIAGTTGGGKSVFFKQTLIGLLKTTPRIQLYLLDLKRGVEMKEFGGLSNVRIAKTEAEACFMLKKIKDEMDRRFIYLEQKGHKEIIPARDLMDKIVVGIDEASVLYSKVKSNPTKAQLINSAREYTDELAKLARAAGIHLILATQKVSKETIDTKVQENIGGRVCFRMNTMTNSVTVLGNKKAFELPDIKGRAIWASGNDFLEIQAPFLNEEEIKSEIELLQEKINAKYPCFQPMIIIEGEIENDKSVVIPKGN
jgi:hypothetical protein